MELIFQKLHDFVLADGTRLIHRWIILPYVVSLYKQGLQKKNSAFLMDFEKVYFELALIVVILVIKKRKMYLAFKFYRQYNDYNKTGELKLRAERKSSNFDPLT